MVTNGRKQRLGGALAFVFPRSVCAVVRGTLQGWALARDTGGKNVGGFDAADADFVGGARCAPSTHCCGCLAHFQAVAQRVRKGLRGWRRKRRLRREAGRVLNMCLVVVAQTCERQNVAVVTSVESLRMRSKRTTSSRARVQSFRAHGACCGNGALRRVIPKSMILSWKRRYQYFVLWPGTHRWSHRACVRNYYFKIYSVLYCTVADWYSKLFAVSGEEKDGAVQRHKTKANKAFTALSWRKASEDHV